MNGSVLETPRLILRPFAPEDIPAILAIHRDEEVNRFLPWFPLKDMEDAERFYRDLGYGLRREYWHRGIVSEAVQALVDRARADGLPFVTATHDVNNPSSGMVMRRIGMRYCYSYEERWMPKDFLVTFRMYQLNLDGDARRVYRGYWEKYPKHFIEKELEHEAI